MRDPQDRMAFGLALIGLAEVFGQEMSEPRSNAYWAALAEFDIADVTRGCAVALRTLKFFPKPSELIELIQGSADDRAQAAWNVFLQAVSEGEQCSVKFADPAMAAAMDGAFTGWLPACRALSAGWIDEATNEQKGGCSDQMLAHHRKVFCQHYSRFVRSPYPLELYRAGLGELSLKQAAAAERQLWARRMPETQQTVLLLDHQQVRKLRLPFVTLTGELTVTAQALLANPPQQAQLTAAKPLALSAAPVEDDAPATSEEIAAIRAEVKRLAASKALEVAA